MPLKEVYKSNKYAHGFVDHRSIVTNALNHKRKNYVLNLDLSNFFGTINFGRIQGLFKSYPFKMSNEAASVMAQLCTSDNALPQGSPVSPILSNFIAYNLDKKLSKLAREYKLSYTRYADDITFSSSMNQFPKDIALLHGDNISNGKIILGEVFKREIELSGFIINYNKVRLQNSRIRQEVTGLTVNEFPNIKREYVRRIRAMLHAWDKFGLLNAEQDLLKKYTLNPPEIFHPDGSYFKSVFYGRLAFIKMVRGENDSIYLKLCLKASKLDDNMPDFLKDLIDRHQEFDVFLSHASEDKDSIAKPIKEACSKLGISVFLDSEQIKWGDSLTEKINSGLGRSKYVLAVLSKHSVGKTWPAKEVNAAIAREIDGKQVILPLVVDKADLTNFSLLSDKLYLDWEGDAEYIAGEIQKLLQSRLSE